MEDNDIIDISMDFDNYASKFGGGVELLMNDKKQKKNEQTSDIDIEDLNNLENELNDLLFQAYRRRLGLSKKIS